MNSSEYVESASDSEGRVVVMAPVPQEPCSHAESSFVLVGRGTQEGEPYHLLRCQTCGADHVRMGEPQ